MSIWISISSIIIYTNFSTIVLAVLFFNIGSLILALYFLLFTLISTPYYLDALFFPDGDAKPTERGGPGCTAVKGQR